MNNNLESILPIDISDESAYHLANFVSELSIMLDSLYLTKMRNYTRKLRKHSQTQKSVMAIAVTSDADDEHLEIDDDFPF